MSSALLICSVLCSLSTADDFIQENQRTLDQIESIHCVVTVADEERQLRKTEMWKSGETTRTLEYRTHAGKGSDQTVRLVWSSGNACRMLVGLYANKDKEVIKSLRDSLEIDKSGLGFIGYVSPKRIELSRSHAWFDMGLDVIPGATLSDIATVSQFAPVSWDGRDPILEVAACKYKALVGMRVTLSSEHGYLIRKRVLSSEGQDFTTRTLDFRKYGELTLPTRVEIQHSQGMTQSEINFIEVNQEIDPACLALNFPKGAAVIDLEKDVVHLWGDNGPEKTFDNGNELRRYLATANQGPVRMPDKKPIDPIIWINVVLIPLIAMLVYLRRRMSRSINN